jgi:hypothetical protein
MIESVPSEVWSALIGAVIGYTGVTLWFWWRHW